MRIRRLVRRDLAANAGDFLLASLGAVAGVAVLVLALGLSASLRRAALVEEGEQRLVEVVRRTHDLGLWALRLELAARGFDSATLERLGAVDGVAEAYGKAVLAVPAVARGGEGFLGFGFVTEVLIEGLDPAALPRELQESFAAADRAPPVAAECPAAGCSNGYYCAGGECRPYLPVLISPQLVELYNSSVRQAYGLPKLDPEAAVGVSCELEVGRSTLPGASRSVIRRERLRLVGVSELAMKVGLSLPLEQVLRLNRECGAGDPERLYSSALLRLDRPESLPRAVAGLEAMDFEVLDRRDTQSARLLALLGLGGVLVSVALLLLSSLHLMHVFALQVAAREEEIGLLRALGASRVVVGRMLLSEAALVGLCSGFVGALLGLVAAALLGRLLPDWVPAAAGLSGPLFAPQLWPALVAVAVATLAACLGALPPTVRIAKKDPAQALRGI